MAGKMDAGSGKYVDGKVGATARRVRKKLFSHSRVGTGGRGVGGERPVRKNDMAAQPSSQQPSGYESEAGGTGERKFFGRAYFCRT